MGNAAAAFDDLAPIEGEVVNDFEADPDSLPRAPLELEAAGDDTEESARAAWALSANIG